MARGTVLLALGAVIAASVGIVEGFHAVGPAFSVSGMRKGGIDAISSSSSQAVGGAAVSLFRRAALSGLVGRNVANGRVQSIRASAINGPGLVLGPREAGSEEFFDRCVRD